MNLYLESSLAIHRHGRFFQTQLDASPASDPPESGLVLMHGNKFQAMDNDLQNIWWDWCKGTGHALLLVPPFDAGSIFDLLDWKIQIEVIDNEEEANLLPMLVIHETSMAITGSNGEFDRSAGHQWKNFSVNTRFYKTHSRSGVFAATCLPLWTISLIDHAPETLEWLSSLCKKAGVATEEDKEGARADVSLDENDYATLLISHAWRTGSGVEMAKRSSEFSTMFRLSSEELSHSLRKLCARELIDESGLTAAGDEVLRQSPYAIYAETLAKEFNRETG